MSTRAALEALDAATASTLDRPGLAQRAVDRLSGWLSGRTSRRGFLVRAGVVGTALATDPLGYVLEPGTAYANVCGPATTASGGWTVFCATINDGVNACPPGSIAAGWWKADGASLCGGSARYIVDCNATCSRCSSPGARAGICSSSCWSCRCTTGPSGSCDRRRNCCNAFRYGQCNTQVRQVGGVHCRVVSCTPPWRWERCSTSPATDDRTRDHNSDALPTGWSPVQAHYAALGSQGSGLGGSVHTEFSVAGGRAQRYQDGRISWSRGTGAHATLGAVSRRYMVLGGEGGVLGFPASDTARVGDGLAARFQHGRISWSPATGAWETLHSTAVRYQRAGAERSALGFPVAAPQAVGAGSVSRFTGGRITAHPTLGTFLLLGAVAERYAGLDAETGALGFPTGDDRAVPGTPGRAASFQHGRISWHPDLGAFETRGTITEVHLALGAERGPLGFPVGGVEQVALRDGTASRFAGGRVSASNEGTGTWAVLGPVAQAYERAGAEAGLLGFPTTAQYAPAPGLRRSDFERGTITHDEATGQTTVEPWVAPGS